MPFKRELLGYDRGQVDAAIAKLTLDAAEAAQHVERLTAELDRQRVAIDGLRQDHEQLSQALVSAHKAAQDIRKAAEADAETTTIEARHRADVMIRDAEEAVKVIEGEVDALLKRRRDAELAYAAFIESIVRTFETTRATSRPSVNAFP
jgi:cell division septum initiation protein DivIVA